MTETTGPAPDAWGPHGAGALARAASVLEGRGCRFSLIDGFPFVLFVAFVPHARIRLLAWHVAEAIGREVIMVPNGFAVVADPTDAGFAPTDGLMAVARRTGRYVPAHVIRPTARAAPPAEMPAEAAG